MPSHVSRSAGHDDLAASIATFRSEVNDPIGIFDHVEVVFDDEDGIARFDEAIEDVQQALNIGKVESRRGLIQDVQSSPGRTLG